MLPSPARHFSAHRARPFAKLTDVADDVMRQYFDAWVTFGQVTRERAEEIVRQLVQAGDVQREQFEAWVERLLERGQANTQAVAEIVRTEVANQLTSMGLVSREDVAHLEARLDDLGRRLRSAASAPARRAKKTAEKARPKRAAAKKGAPKRAGATKTRAKKAATKRSATSSSARGARAKKARR